MQGRPSVVAPDEDPTSSGEQPESGGQSGQVEDLLAWRKLKRPHLASVDFGPEKGGGIGGGEEKSTRVGLPLTCPQSAQPALGQRERQCRPRVAPRCWWAKKKLRRERLFKPK